MPPPDGAPPSPLAATAERWGDTTALDPAVDAVARAAGPLETPGPVHEALAGAWLGHSADPPCTAFLVARRRGSRATGVMPGRGCGGHRGRLARRPPGLGLDGRLTAPGLMWPGRRAGMPGRWCLVHQRPVVEERRGLLPRRRHADGVWTYDRRSRQYYLHRFYRTQPDVNIANPAVRRRSTPASI